jgi:hypothetical protein
MTPKYVDDSEVSNDSEVSPWWVPDKLIGKAIDQTL